MRLCGMSPSSSYPRRPKSRVFTLLLLFAVYVLSYGPVRGLYVSERLSGPMPNGWVTFYQPVRWLYENTPLGRPMTSYDAWWAHAFERV